MRHFTLSFIVTLMALGLSFMWAGLHGLFICGLMTLMEISFSFDNAVVNAIVLRGMSPLWQKRFLTWGMLIAVFGMYYFFPIFIVSMATGLGLINVMQLAMHAPETYSRHLHEAHTQIASFGGMFLLMVFLHFIFDETKQLHWLGKIEEKLSKLGKLEAVEIIIALVLLGAVLACVPEAQRKLTLVSGIIGIALYVAIHRAIVFLGMANMSDLRVGADDQHSSIVGFIYLNLLDASFSLDAVVGSFAISSDIVIIVLGLTAGAMFVRSLTVHLVRKGTLDQYVFLEHGAHYAIGALAMVMLVSILLPVPEMVSGLVGVVVVLLSFWSSMQHNQLK